MKRIAFAVASLLCLSLTTVAQERAGGTVSAWRAKIETGPLQQKIDALAPGDVLELRGTELGPIVIRTPGITIDGGGTAVIDGRRQSSVVVVDADDVTIRDITIEGSGDFSPRVDAGVAITSRRNIRLHNLTIRDVLFGIDVSESSDVIIEGCDISSKDVDPNYRGDAIRLWSSKDVHLQGNHWHDARDAVAWYSERVKFLRNTATRNRYSIHSMYSDSLIIEENEFDDNSVGIFIMYGTGTTVLRNTVRRSSTLTGIGLGLKETSSVYAEENSFIYCATGILVDNSPWEPQTRNWFLGNQLMFNDVGILLANDRQNEFRGNVFRANRRDVDSEQRRKSPGIWRGNYWDDYGGFDRDRDGIGDTPYIPKKYGDLLTGEHPSARYFEGSPIVALISLIERLVPMTEPIELLEDPEPRLL